MSNAANNKQLKLIHTLKHALKMSDEAYRDKLATDFKVSSSTLLTFRQAGALITVLESDAISQGVWRKFEGKAKFEDYSNRPGMGSPAQLRKIEALWNDFVGIKDYKKRSKALRTFLNRRFKISDLRFLDMNTTKKVIYALNCMVMKKTGAQPGGTPTLAKSAAV